jgi:hypothetical protein
MMRAALLCFTVTVCFASQAAAANIINKDTSSHQLELSCDGATTYATLPPNAVQADAVHEGCFVTLKKNGAKLKVADGDVLIVKGKLKNAAAPTG